MQPARPCISPEARDANSLSKLCSCEGNLCPFRVCVCLFVSLSESI